MTDEALETLCRSLEQGKSEQLIKYLDVMSRFPKYSFRNLLLILIQKPEASRVMGYKSWQQFGRQVRKGERGIRIWAPMKIETKKEERGARESLKKQRELEETLLFRPVSVFDESQTEGKPLPSVAEVSGDPGVLFESLKRFASDKGIRVCYQADVRGKGVSKCGEILLRVGLEPAVEFYVLAHEIAHELIHSKEIRKRLSEKQSDYIQFWDGERDTVSDSLATIQRVAGEVISALLK